MESEYKIWKEEGKTNAKQEQNLEIAKQETWMLLKEYNWISHLHWIWRDFLVVPSAKGLHFMFQNTKTHLGRVFCRFISMKRQYPVFFISLWILCLTSFLYGVRIQNLERQNAKQTKHRTNLGNCQTRNLNAADWIHPKIPFTLDVEGIPSCPLGKRVKFHVPKHKNSPWSSFL